MSDLHTFRDVPRNDVESALRVLQTLHRAGDLEDADIHIAIKLQDDWHALNDRIRALGLRPNAPGEVDVRTP